ncbi:MAG: DUF1902 domain-containing protein [Desulfobacterales bacterium]|nr:DUF1902 domain-containing protein [Desulfobacterales bacterium]
MSNPLFVRAEWDAEAGVWVATSDDVPGLATESETIEALIEKLRIMDSRTTIGQWHALR